MLTASNIKTRTFSSSKAGYDPEEVRDFLEDVARDYQAAINAKEESDAKIAELEAQISQYKEDEEAIKSSLVIANRESNKIINEAKAQARDMIESAKSEQVRLSEQSVAECERIIKEHRERCAEIMKQDTENTQRKMQENREAFLAEKARLEELKREVTLFKAELLPLYQKQLALIMQLPEADLDDEDEEEAEPEAVEEAPAEAEETVDEAAEEAARIAAEKEAAAKAEKEHIDKILNTGSFEPVIPKENLQDLKFGKNN
ncbi:MAG: DivIVA domain-containing protein [Ruminococcus sp.]|nr:DivIVA domain-containing protein [Ruminococcus sp.]